MDKIILKNLKFYGYHGVLPEETKLGQKFIIDIELFSNLKPAGISDDLTKSTSYAEVFESVKKIVEGKPLKLIEALAEKIAETILSEYNLINSLKVKVKKPEAPVPGIYDYFAVEITRNRDE
ncbi:MAG: dihydroneopterin aldolase [Spirochaetaceae bacterium]